MACDLELKNHRNEEDFRIQLFQIQEDLISKIDNDYALSAISQISQLKGEIEELKEVERLKMQAGPQS